MEAYSSRESGGAKAKKKQWWWRRNNTSYWNQIQEIRHRVSVSLPTCAVGISRRRWRPEFSVVYIKMSYCPVTWRSTFTEVVINDSELTYKNETPNNLTTHHWPQRLQTWVESTTQSHTVSNEYLGGHVLFFQTAVWFKWLSEFPRRSSCNKIKYRSLVVIIVVIQWTVAKIIVYEAVARDEKTVLPFVA